MCTFYCPRRKKRCTGVHIQQLVHKKDVNFAALLPYYYGKVIVELEKTQARNSTYIYGAYNLTK